MNDEIGDISHVNERIINEEQKRTTDSLHELPTTPNELKVILGLIQEFHSVIPAYIRANGMDGCSSKTIITAAVYFASEWERVELRYDELGLTLGTEERDEAE